MLRVDREAGSVLDAQTVESVIERAESALESAGVLVLQDYDKGVLGEGVARRLLDAAARLGVPTIVDPKLRHFFEFRGAHVFKPNLRELAAAMGVEPAAIGTADLTPMVSRLGVANLLLTLGEDGMLMLGEDVDGVVRVPAVAREVYDVTGAGDTVLAVMTAALLGDATLPEGARLATIAAGIEVSRLGAVPVTRDELLTEIEQHS
jgi:D-beta-D-heptose 7-phosphate kinase/D-beta-D-heptose 1-phosphate adenosyltransferase